MTQSMHFETVVFKELFSFINFTFLTRKWENKNTHIELVTQKPKNKSLTIELLTRKWSRKSLTIELVIWGKFYFLTLS